MPTNFLSQICRVTTGALNTVNDAVAGQPIATITGNSPYLGQSGQRFILGEADANQMSSGTTLHAGEFMYTQFDTTMTATPAAGLAAFFDSVLSGVNGAFVTCDENIGVGPNLFAGVVLNAVTKGNFGFIQCSGLVSVKFRTTLTAPGAAVAGCSVYLSQAGAGADVATFDVLDDANPATQALVGQQIVRYVGVAKTAPVANTASPVYLNNINRFVW